MKIKLSELIAPSFFSVFKDIRNNGHTEYMLKGGRGSTKSTFISLMIILGIMEDAQNGNHTHAVVMRKVARTLKDSVVAQLAWAINALGVAEQWNVPKAKLELTFIPTGQKILFQGADNPQKIKSITVPKGNIKYIWYEELDEFSGPEELRTINQSLMRGSDNFILFYSYNPPMSARSWVNTEARIIKPNRLTHHSDYRDVPEHWLGQVFITEAEHLAKVNEQAYKHEYLGEEVGTGLEIFNNVKVRAITDSEISNFDYIKQGIDFGYSIDPVVFERMHYYKLKKQLFIFDEYTGLSVSNKQLANYIMKKNYHTKLSVADSAEPKSIAEIKRYGVNIEGVKKGPDSRDYGIKFLQDLEQIIIDSNRCPLAAKEFVNYSYTMDRQGNIRREYPKKEDHTIDAVRYGLKDEMETKTKWW